MGTLHDDDVLCGFVDQHFSGGVVEREDSGLSLTKQVSKSFDLENFELFSFKGDKPMLADFGSVA